MQIKNIKEIIAFYEEKFSIKKPQEIGVEWERFGIIPVSSFRNLAGSVSESIAQDKYPESNGYVPAQYIGGYEEILKGLQKKYNWEILDEYNSHPFTLKKNKSLITTEGDGKPEISGSPFQDLHDVFAELEKISGHIQELSKPLGIEWIDSGLQPFHKTEDLQLAPKPRYQTFLKIFSDRGHGKWMSLYMKALSGVHINIDVDNTNDLIEKTQTMFRISPLMCGIFANSPLLEGEANGLMSNRRKKNFCEKCKRSYLMSGMLDENFSLEKWIQWYITQPMIVIFRGEKTLTPPENFTFQDFMENGFEGEFPTIEDFDVHLKTMWVDIRFRVGYLEFRPLDTLPLEFIQASTALFTGIMYGKNSFEEIKKILEDWKEEEEYMDIHKAAWTNGIRAEYKGINFVEAGKKLFSIAEKTLIERGKGEEKFLASLKFLLDNKVSPADFWLQEV